jgi:hypothetical protein
MKKVFLISIFSFLAFFVSFSPVKASDTLTNHFGYYCEDVASSTYALDSNHFTALGYHSCHYIGSDLPIVPSPNWYGDLYQQGLSTSTIITGHFLSSSGNFNKIQGDTYPAKFYTGQVYFVVFYDYNQCGSALRNHFENAESPPSCDWGYRNWVDIPYTEIPENIIYCDRFDFGGLGIGNAVCSVFEYLFKPSETSLQNFSNLADILETKAPFSYFYSVKNSLNSLSSSSTPTFVLADTGGINTSIFQPLKTGLAWILWIFFAFWVIRRIGVFVP